MMRSVKLLFSVILLFCFGATTAYAAEESAGTKPAILFLGAHVQEQPLGIPNKYRLRQILPDTRIQDKLNEQGYVWAADFFSTKMTWEFLKRFNAIVMLDFPIIEKHPTVKDEIRAAEKLLQRYVREGGGLLLTGTTGYSMWAMERNTEELNRFLEAFDAAVLKEQVGEKNGAFCLPRPTPQTASALAWTGNVAKHSLTEGVRGFLYPTDYAWCYYTRPLKPGPDWQVLLKGSETAYSFTVKLGTGKEQSTKKPGAYESEPPLLAVREAGKGRIALWSTIPSITIIDGYHPFWGNGLIMTARDAKHPSDGEKLLFNLFQWLTEPSRKVFGDYKPKAIKDKEREPGLFAIDWDKVQLKGKEYPNTHKGLVGLKSSLSSGASSPQEMIDAAKEAGYHFAAFSEDLEQLTAEKLAALRETCARNSNKEFLAYPGFIYHDASGNAWQVFGAGITWPKDDWWQDKKAQTIVKNNMIFRGYQFYPVIMVHPNRNPEPPWFQGNFKGMAVYTYESGKLVDDATEVYKRLQGDGFALFPVVIHIVRSAAEVKAAAEDNFLQTYVPWWERSDLISAMGGNYSKYKDRYVFQRTPFVSSGPLVEAFRVHNFGTSDLAVPNGDRFRMHLRLTSEKGLNEVTIFDNLKLWRRFKLSGEKEWSVILDGFHDRNHHFIAVAKDTGGGKVVTTDRWTNVQEINIPRCTDNINTYFSGKYMAQRAFALRGLESYVDRQAGNFYFFPRIDEIKETQRFAVDQRLTFISRFGFIKNDVLHHFYPPTASANWNANDIPEIARPQTALAGHVTTTLFTPWADSTAVYLVEGEFEALRDLEIPRKEIPIYTGVWTKEAETFLLARKNKAPFCASLRVRKSSYNGPLADVEYVAQLAAYGGSRAVVPLSSNMIYTVMQGGGEKPNYYLRVGLQLDRPQLARGESRAYRYLAVWTESGAPPDNTFIEDIVNKLGLRGKTAYAVKPVRGGVIDTKFALRLRAKDYGFAGTITEAKLPLRLPVFIEGLNTRWPAGIWYKGRNQLVIPVWTMDRVHQRYAMRRKVVENDPIFRFGVLENGTGMLQIDSEIGDKEVFIGNLLVCDQPEVFLELEDWRKGKERIAVNNPTDRELMVTVRPGPGFDLLGVFEKTVKIPAGGLVVLSLKE